MILALFHGVESVFEMSSRCLAKLYAGQRMRSPAWGLYKILLVGVVAQLEPSRQLKLGASRRQARGATVGLKPHLLEIQRFAHAWRMQALHTVANPLRGDSTETSAFRHIFVQMRRACSEAMAPRLFAHLFRPELMAK